MHHSTAKTLHALLNAFREKKPFELKAIGNSAIRRAAIQDDRILAEISVISYALYKILSKDHFVKSSKWPKVEESISGFMSKSIDAAERQDSEALKMHLRNALQSIEKIDSELSNYAENLREKAIVKQASTAYAMGLSLSQAASLTGADKKELQKYIGFTRIHDEHPAKKGIAERLLVLKEVLGK